ncbi:MAG TPA: ribonuclease H-like domain-containing protein, partial [Chthoniobacterales bacterium]
RRPEPASVGTIFVSMNIVYFDLETQRTANDVGGWDRKRDMGMSVGVTFSSDQGEYRIFREKRVDELIQQLLRADLVVGYNVVNFDYEVLMGYTVLDLPHYVPTLDLLVDIEKRIGLKPKLDNVAQTTLGVGKTADGIDAIKWWRERRMMEIAEYCCYDVKVTKLVHEYGRQNRELFYTDKFNRKQKFEVGW